MRLEQYIKELYEYDFFGSLDESGAGISRVLSKLDSDLDFLFITASRDKNSNNQNRSNNNKLIKDIRLKLGKAGAYKIIGHWKECSVPLKDNDTVKDCKGKLVDSLEETWLIIKPDNVSSDVFNKMAMNLSKKYDQDAYVIRLNGMLTLRGKDGSVWDNLGKANRKSLSTGFNKIVNVQGYSELSKIRKRGRIQNIVFEGLYLSVPKDNNSSRKLFDSIGIMY